jgi:hypothetical protein
VSGSAGAQTTALASHSQTTASDGRVIEWSVGTFTSTIADPNVMQTNGGQDKKGKLSVGAIVGIVLGVLVLLCFLLALCCLWRQKRSERKVKDKVTQQVYVNLEEDRTVEKIPPTIISEVRLLLLFQFGTYDANIDS